MSKVSGKKAGKAEITELIIDTTKSRKTKSKKTSKIDEVLTELVSERSVTEYCTHYFELRDKKKILERFSVKKLYKMENKFYTICKNKSEKNSDKCKKHIGVDGISLSDLEIVINMGEIEAVKDVKDLNHYQFMVVVNSQIKLKAEKILSVLDKKRREDVKKYVRPEEKPREVDSVPDVREEIKPVQYEDSLSDIEEKSLKSDSYESDCSEISCYSFEYNDKKYYYNGNLEIIDMDDEGLGFNCGSLLICDSNRYDIILNNNKYLVRFNV